ncbi:helix-turn-helix domain-containing protein [Enterococcus sp. AZ109]|uniref:helix-turn-helix domain-containing protein n=1 Tax=Enterococcus sp. AZ109 TaxID=2774634 RepID=UPI003F20203C
MLREQNTNNHNMLWLTVKQRMEAMQINQSELARRADVNTTVISALKLGKIEKPSFELICKIAKALEMSLDDFVN